MTQGNKVVQLDMAQPQKVSYCIELWLRDEQIKRAIARVSGRIQPSTIRRPEPVAVVGFGPSLNDTWEQVKDFKHVISCSGAHKFLIERGIVPNWHVEVDPRDHKIALLGAPHADVEYLISSTCHPKYFDHLAGFNVKLWHVFDPSEDGLRLLPPGEWAVTGGCDAGLRALTIAAFLGFRDLHVFGLDGCAKGADALRHASEHPYGKQKYATTEYKGKTYWTTPAMLTAAMQTFYELDQMPIMRATFYGDGLVQDMAKDHVWKEAPDVENPFSNIVGFVKPSLISAEYAALNTQLHHENLAYGVGGGKHAPMVLKLSAQLKTQSVLDYGCGKSYLAKALPFPIWEYDPAIPGKELTPRPADIVVCTDVLEHIEPERLRHVLGDLSRCVKKVGFFVIHTGPARKTLPDGRNTHLIQHGKKWWTKQLEKHFKVGQIWPVGPELYAVVGPKTQAIPQPIKPARLETAQLKGAPGA